MANNEQVLKAVLRVQDEMTSQLVAPTKALQGLEDSAASADKAFSSHFTGMFNAAKQLAAGINTSMAQVTRTLQGVTGSSDAMGASLAKHLTQMRVLSAGVQMTAASNAELAESNKEVGDGFSRSERQSAKFAQRTALLTNKLLGLHFIVQTLGTKFGKGEFGQEVQAASDGLQIFAGIVGIMPNKIGVAVGAVAGLGVALYDLLGPSKEVQASIEKILNTIGSIRGTRAGLEEQAAMKDVETKLRADAGMKPVSDVDASKTEQARLLKKGAGLQRELDILVNDKTLINNGAGDLTSKRLADLRKELGETEAALKKTTGELVEFEKVAEDKKAVDDFTKTIDGLNDSSNTAAMMMDAGLITPAKEASKQLEITDQKLEALFKVKGKMKVADWNMYNEMFTGPRPAQQEAVDQHKAVEDARKAAEAKEREDQREREKRAAHELENQWGVALPKAVDEYVQSMKTAKDFMVEMFQATQGAINSAFEDLLSGGKRAKDAWKSFLKDMKTMLIRSVSDMMSQNVMKNFMGLFGMFGGGGGGPAPVATGGGTGTSTGSGGTGSAAPGLGGGINLSSLGTSLGIGSDTMGAIGGAIGGGVMAYQGYKSGSSGATTMGLAMAGMSIGAMAGPIGAVAGLAVGAIVGAVMSRSNRRRAKRARRRAAYLAAIQHAEAVNKARIVLKQDIRNKMGGGLATEDAAAEIGQLFSEDLSENEIAQFGSPEAIAARAGEVNNQTHINAPITVNATITGDYDAARLAEALSYHMQSQMGGAATGL